MSWLASRSTASGPSHKSPAPDPVCLAWLSSDAPNPTGARHAHSFQVRFSSLSSIWDSESCPSRDLRHGCPTSPFFRAASIATTSARWLFLALGARASHLVEYCHWVTEHGGYNCQRTQPGISLGTQPSWQTAFHSAQSGKTWPPETSAHRHQILCLPSSPTPPRRPSSARFVFVSKASSAAGYFFHGSRQCLLQAATARPPLRCAGLAYGAPPFPLPRDRRHLSAVQSVLSTTPNHNCRAQHRPVCQLSCLAPITPRHPTRLSRSPAVHREVDASSTVLAGLVHAILPPIRRYLTCSAPGSVPTSDQGSQGELLGFVKHVCDRSYRTTSVRDLVTAISRLGDVDGVTG